MAHKYMESSSALVIIRDMQVYKNSVKILQTLKIELPFVLSIPQNLREWNSGF